MLRRWRKRRPYTGPEPVHPPIPVPQRQQANTGGIVLIGDVLDVAANAAIGVNMGGIPGMRGVIAPGQISDQVRWYTDEACFRVDRDGWYLFGASATVWSDPAPDDATLEMAVRHGAWDEHADAADWSPGSSSAPGYTPGGWRWKVVTTWESYSAARSGENITLTGLHELAGNECLGLVNNGIYPTSYHDIYFWVWRLGPSGHTAASGF